MVSKTLQIEVVYANPTQQALIRLDLPMGAAVETAIVQSGVLTQFPEIDLAVNAVGIFSKKVSLDYVLSNGDRVEIYRPLLIDPKQARRKRALNKAK